MKLTHTTRFYKITLKKREKKTKNNNVFTKQNKIQNKGLVLCVNMSDKKARRRINKIHTRWWGNFLEKEKPFVKTKSQLM